MQITNVTKYEEWKSKNTDGYGAEIFRYAEAWANLMEQQMAEGKELKSIAEQTSHAADTKGITGFMYGAAMSVLHHHWTHGEELRQWHNLKTQIGSEGKQANKSGGVLNPAMVRIG